jgi:predicted nucleic acid-binding protein
LNLLVDTSVWSLALRRDKGGSIPEVEFLTRALTNGESILTTGIILQELLQGFRGPKDRDAILERFSALPLLVPDRDDHVQAAELRNECRRRGVQVGTIDALIARLAIRHEVTLLTTDRDFERVARFAPLALSLPPS